MPRLVLALTLAAALSGCGGDDEASVEEYVETANAAQAQFQPALERADRIMRRFASGERAGPGAAKGLKEVASTMRGVEAQLALVEPPEEARRLHADLRRLVDLQSWLALELGLLAEYVPAAERALRPPVAAGTTLNRRLDRAEGAGEQRAALNAYAAALDRALRRLDSLSPPPALRPWHDGQADRLRASRGLARQLSAAIRESDRAAVERALKAFEANTPDPASVHEAQKAAVARFNARIREQQRLVRRIAREQYRLLNG